MLEPREAGPQGVEESLQERMGGCLGLERDTPGELFRLVRSVGSTRSRRRGFAHRIRG